MLHAEVHFVVCGVSMAAISASVTMARARSGFFTGSEDFHVPYHIIGYIYDI